MTDYPCRLCRTLFPRTLAYYVRRTENADGLSTACRPCVRAQKRQQYAANPEPVKARVQARRERQRQRFANYVMPTTDVPSPTDD